MQSVARPSRASRRRSSCSSETTSRAPLMPSGWPRAIAPPLTFTRSGSMPSSRTTASDCDANASFSSTRSMSPTRDARAREQLRDGGDGTDAHHARVDAGRGRAAEHAERLDAEVARPLLAGDHERRRAVVDAARVAGRDGATRPERGLQRAELLGRRLGPRVLVALDAGDRHQLVGEPAGGVRLGPALLRAERERVLVLPRDTPPFGHVLAGLAHRLGRELRGVGGVHEPPAERGVVQRAVAALERLRRLRGHQRRARHRLDAAGDEQVAVARRPPRGRRPRPRSDPRRRAGSRSRRRRCRAGRRAARRTARRCGCPRPPRWRSPATRPRSRPPARRCARPRRRRRRRPGRRGARRRNRRRNGRWEYGRRRG